MENFGEALKRNLKSEAKNWMSIIKTSKGRDKVFALIQYIVDLYCKCMKFSYMSSPYQT